MKSRILRVSHLLLSMVQIIIGIAIIIVALSELWQSLAILVGVFAAVSGTASFLGHRILKRDLFQISRRQRDMKSSPGQTSSVFRSDEQAEVINLLARIESHVFPDGDRSDRYEKHPVSGESENSGITGHHR